MNNMKVSKSDNNFHSILKFAVEQKASDVHIAADKSVFLRISGELVGCEYSPGPDEVNTILDMILTPEMQEKYNRDGDVDLSYSEDEIGRFRVNVHKQRGYPVLTLRHVKSKILDFNQLNLPPQFKDLSKKPRGIIFISGTTGSGKSTTLASMIDYINTNQSRHIITIEDPIEYEFYDKESFIEQREVGFDTISFNSAFVHALRQDPDIIMVGEMRNKETFDCALRAADTGHLVLSTLHTMNASQAINRILNLYNADEHQALRYSLANNLTAVVSQRLVPAIDNSGVVPAVEIMINTSVVQQMLMDNKLGNLAKAIEKGKSDGMQSFNQSLVELVKNKRISEEDALVHATNPEALKMNLKGVFISGEESGILG